MLILQPFIVTIFLIHFISQSVADCHKRSQMFQISKFLENKDLFVKPHVNPPTVHCAYFFNTFYQSSKSLLLGKKCVIDRQTFKNFV